MYLLTASESWKVQLDYEESYFFSWNQKVGCFYRFSCSLHSFKRNLWSLFFILKQESEKCWGKRWWIMPFPQTAVYQEKKEGIKLLPLFHGLMLLFYFHIIPISGSTSWMASHSFYSIVASRKFLKYCSQCLHHTELYAIVLPICREQSMKI